MLGSQIQSGSGFGLKAGADDAECETSGCAAAGWLAGSSWTFEVSGCVSWSHHGTALGCCCAAGASAATGGAGLAAGVFAGAGLGHSAMTGAMRRVGGAWGDSGDGSAGGFLAGDSSAGSGRECAATATAEAATAANSGYEAISSARGRLGGC